MIRPITTENIHAANGRLAAGAKSPEGLARSAKNATKHGLSGRAFCLLNTENPEVFAAQKAEIFAALAPRDAIEVNFATRILEATWLIQRCQVLATRALSSEIESQRADHAPSHPQLSETDLAAHATETLLARSRTLELYERYRVSYERSLLRFHNALIKHRATLGKHNPPLPAEIADTPCTTFLDRTIGETIPQTPVPLPQVQTDVQLKSTPRPAVRCPECANYETNPLPQPELKFTFAAEVPAAPKPINPISMSRPNHDSKDAASRDSRPLHPKSERIA